MPSPIDYRKILGQKTNGQVRKEQSDSIMDVTWWEDIQSRVGYLYDYYHDNYVTKLEDMKSDKDDSKVPIDIKFVMSSSQTYDKDQVTFHIQLRPSQQCNVDYYEEVFKERYDATFPIGLYIDIPDEQGIFNRWLIVDRANYNVTQFPTFEVLRCDKVFQWIMDNVKMQCAGVLRSQNSYNSGIWTDHISTTVEDQYKFAVPLNRDTEKLYYNQRIIIDNKVLSEPRTWQITKINRMAPNGIDRLTVAQNHFDQNKDFVEKDDYGNIIGMWADYFSSPIEPSDRPSPDPEPADATIEYLGGNPNMKVGGGYKKYSIIFADGKFRPGTWKFFIRETEEKPWEPFTDIMEITDGLSANEIKLHFGLDKDKTSGKQTKDYYKYINSILKIKYITNDGIETSLDTTVTSL